LALLWAGQAAADYQAGVDAYNAKKFTTAMSEWMPLAEAGDPVAQNSVGALYDHGLGVEESDAEAALWYQRAAEQGLPLAMRNLGEKYLTGHGVPFDPAAAAEWLGKAPSLATRWQASAWRHPWGNPAPHPQIRNRRRFSPMAWEPGNHSSPLRPRRPDPSRCSRQASRAPAMVAVNG
jgi:hypothetical protein